MTTFLHPWSEVPIEGRELEVGETLQTEDCIASVNGQWRPIPWGFVGKKVGAEDLYIRPIENTKAEPPVTIIRHNENVTEVRSNTPAAPIRDRLSDD